MIGWHYRGMASSLPNKVGFTSNAMKLEERLLSLLEIILMVQKIFVDIK
jgi:hypothetical protein